MVYGYTKSNKNGVFDKKSRLSGQKKPLKLAL